MCGAISTLCNTENCNNMARYGVYCYWCNKEEKD